jgi:HD-like signal output (HDOD) protein
VTKRVLFVDGDADERLRLKAGFASMMGVWEMEFAATGAEALAFMKAQQFDAIISDTQMPDMTAAQLIAQVAKQYANTVRFIRGNPDEKETVAQNVQGIHQFLSKSSDLQTLKLSLSRALALDVWLSNPQIRSAVGRIRTFPSLPSIYTAVLRELKSPDASTHKVGDLIGKDLAMTTKILQMLNSVFYGLPRQITDLGEAIGILGLDTVKSLVLGIQLFSQYDKVKPAFFSVDRLWKHSTLIAKSAREITLFETKDETMADEAYTAGLLHDIGKMVLVSNFDEQYHGAQSLARKNSMPLWEVEHELFGVSHSEIGAYLLGLWGMPLGILEAAALHHTPGRCPNKFFCPLSAVHAANALAYEIHPENDSLVPPALDTEYVASLGLTNHLDLWRDMMVNQKLAGEMAAHASKQAEPKPEAPSAAKTTDTNAGTQSPSSDAIPVLATVTETSRPKWLSSPLTWVYAGALLLLLGFAVFYMLRRGEGDEPVAGLSPTTTNTAANTPPPEIAPSEPPETPQPPAAVAKGPTMPPTRGTNAVVSHAPPPRAEPVFPTLRLQGITYQVSNPTALIDGESVRIGSIIKGVHVTAIGPDSVTLEFAGKKKSLTVE